MIPSGPEQWLRIFDVPETKHHQDGYTVYRIVSTLLHRSFPEASTSLEVWRRYSAILKLHKEIIKLHHLLNLPENPPVYSKPSIINRFDDKVIEERRKYTLTLLRYCAKYPSIYASEQFTRFFKDGFDKGKRRLSFIKPRENKSSLLASSLGVTDGGHSLYAQLNENTSSSEDLSGLNAVGESVVESDVVGDLLKCSGEDRVEREKKHGGGGGFGASIVDSEESLGGAGCERRYSRVTLEKNILSEGSESKSVGHSIPGPPSRDRKNQLGCTPNSVLNMKQKQTTSTSVESAKMKEKEGRKKVTAGYLQKAEKLISKLSLREGRAQQKTSDGLSDSVCSLRGLSCDLNNYRVVGTSGKIIVAVDLTTQETVAIKVIEKSSESSTPLLPCSVPFMVPILRYHETEFAFYLITKYVSGGKLWNHLKKFIKQPLPVPPIAPPSRYGSDSRSSTYEGQRLIYDEKMEEAVSADTRSQQSFQHQEFDSSERDQKSTSFCSNLAVAECKSSIDPHSNSCYRFESPHYQSSLSHIIDFQSPQDRHDDQHSLTRYQKEAPPQGKCKSLDDLNSSKDDHLERSSLNGETDGMFARAKETPQEKRCKDNDSIGSDTLSGVSDDFSCSSFNPLSEFEVVDFDTSITTTTSSTTASLKPSFAWPKSFDNANFDVNNLIKNSKRLLEDVNKTLEKSKQQIIRTFTSSTDDPLSNDKSVESVSCFLDIETLTNGGERTEPASLYLSAHSNTSDKDNRLSSSKGHQEITKTNHPNFSNIRDRKGISNGASAIVPNFIVESPSQQFIEPPSNNGGLVDPLSSGGSANVDEVISNSPLSCDLSVPFLMENHNHLCITEGNQQIPEGLVRVWLSQVILAMDSLHKQDIIWGDFNPSNLLLDEGGSILVTYKYSLSNSVFYNNLRERGNTEDDWLLSLGYKAPELFNPVSIPTNVSDWWSVGALLFHLLTGKDVASSFPSGVTSHTQISFQSSISDEAASLITNLLCAHPVERLGSSSTGVQEIKDHPFFFGIEWPE